MNALILYFSGTGNTRYAAGLFSDALARRGAGVQMHSVEEDFDPAAYDYDVLLIGFPKYYEYPVLFMWDYLKRRLPVRDKTVPALAFCTQASALHTDFSCIQKVLKSKNHRLTVSRSLPFANNMSVIGLFHTTDAQTAEANKAALASAVDPMLDVFLSGGADVEAINPLLKPLFRLEAVSATWLMARLGVWLSASEACTGCTLCAKRCPVGNIRMSEGKPVFGKSCLFCTRCANACPANAILFRKKKHPQYKCTG